MLTYNERLELRDKLVSGEIEIEFAQEQYWKDFKEGKKSWYTKDWKERRAKLIKDKCQICNSKDTLTLQHLSHPGKYAEYLTEVRRAHTEEYIKTNPELDKTEFRNHILKHYDYTPTPLCPNCKSSNPSRRVRKLPQYRCTECKQEFDEPVYRTVVELISIFVENEDALETRDKCFTSKKWKNNHNLSSVRYWLQRERAVSKDTATIQKEAFLLYLNDDIKYLSFEDTITACKRCASSYDLHGLVLCPQCKEHYKSIQYPTCIQCLPEERRKTVLESIEFGKQMDKIHRDLDMD
jgi:ribosomal protein L37AE/L43A